MSTKSQHISGRLVAPGEASTVQAAIEVHMGAVRPDGFLQLTACHELSSTLHEELERDGRLALERNDAAALPKLARSRIEVKSPKR